MRFKITLKENGIHSLNKGLELFSKYNTSNIKNQFDLRDSILFINNGIELLLKEILVNKVGEHIIFSRLDDSLFKKISQSKLESKSIFDIPNPPNTITFLQAIQRIKALVEYPKLENSLEEAFEKLNSYRNNLQHYGINKTIDEIVSILLPININISDFFNGYGIELGEDIVTLLSEIESELIRESLKLRGSTFYKNLNIKGDTLTIYYFLTFDEYLNLKSSSKIDKEDFNNYWLKGKAVEKMIVEPIRMMTIFDYLENVKIIFGDGLKKYSLEVSKDKFENETEFSIEKLKDSDIWQSFINKYIYKINNPLRVELFKKFVRIEDITDKIIIKGS
jgi:hypothetical protein